MKQPTPAHNSQANIGAAMKAVAIELLGEPSIRKKKELRWGNQGSLSVNLDKGTWYDHEAQEGGGVLDLVVREVGCKRAAAIQWLEQRGLWEKAEQREKAPPPKVINRSLRGFWVASNGVDVRFGTPAIEHAIKLRPEQEIVATFNYRNAAGDIVYRNHRIEPGDNGAHKTFRMDKPNGKGGWCAGAAACKVPYRLQDLLASTGTVYLAEGERQADKLAGWGLTASSLKNWSDDFSKAIAGREVIILPDNDDPGRKQADKAREVLLKAGCAVHTIHLPHLPPKGDIVDWRGNEEDLAKLVADAVGEPFDYDPETGEILERHDAGGDDAVSGDVDPVDLWANHGAPELPQGLLPDAIDTFARSHSAIMGVDPAGLAMACLAVCAAAITDEIKLQVKQHDPTWRESARIWVGLVGSPSMKKTPIISAAARPLKRIDGHLMRAYVEKRQAYDELTVKERKGVDRPRQERRIISDATVEAAQEVLKDSPRGVLSLQDELSGWFGQMDKYAPGKGAQADRGFWLQAYNGGSYSLNRIGRGASYIPNCSIGLLGGIQPEPIRDLAGDTTDDGLIQRLIPVVLRPGKVGRDAPDDGTLVAYEILIDQLEDLRAGDAPLRLDEAARATRERLEAEHLNLAQSLEISSPKMAAHFGKHDGLFARLCVLWHCIEHNQGGRVPNTITGDTAERVAQFMVRFIRPSAVAFYAGLLGMSAEHERLRDLAAWIVATNVDEVKARDVQASGQAFRHVTAEEVRLLCEKLEAFGWGYWADPAIKSNKPRFLVNPRVHSLFAERGRAEAERRAKARELIRQTVGG